MPPFPIARVGGFHPAHVEDPPASARAREKAIRAETGLTADENHDRVRMAASEIERVAYDSQRDILRRVHDETPRLRISIEQLARVIPGVVQAAIRSVGAAIEQTCTKVAAIKAQQITYIRRNHRRVDQQLVAARQRVVTTMRRRLLEGSAHMRDLDARLQASFTANVREAANRVKEVPRTGKARPLDRANFPAPPGGRPRAPAKAQPYSGPATLRDEQPLLVGRLNSTEGKDRIRVYQDAQCAEATPSLIDDRQEQAEHAADDRASKIDSETTRAQFTIVSSGLVAPTAADYDNDKPEAESEAARQMRQQGEVLRTATDRAVDDLETKAKRVQAYLRGDMKKDIEWDLQKTGNKIVAVLRGQAKSAEFGIASLGAPLASSYRETAGRLALMVPPHRFLDARLLVPKVHGLRQALLDLHRQHVKLVSAQVADALKNARKAQRDQIKSLWEAAQHSREAVQKTLIPIQFDFRFTALQYTGIEEDALGESLGEAVRYADESAKHLLEDRRRGEQGITPIDDQARAFLNGSIDGELHIYQEMIRTTEDDLNAAGAPFTMGRQAVAGDLNQRSEKLLTALPEPPVNTTAVGVGAAVTAPLLGPVGIAGAIYYAYHYDPDENDVYQAIGELSWPGQPALEDEFESVRGYGNLRDRIERRMSGDQKQHALDLLSSSESTRGTARAAIADESRGWFGPSRETRERVLRGMSAGELRAVDPGYIRDVRARLAEDLSGNKATIALAYLDSRPGFIEHRHERALMGRIDERLADARANTDDAMARLNDDIDRLAREELGGSLNNSFVQRREIDRLTNAALRLHATEVSHLHDPERDGDLSPARARELFFQYATRDRTEWEAIRARSHELLDLHSWVYNPDSTNHMDSRATEMLRTSLLAPTAVDPTKAREDAAAARQTWEQHRAERETEVGSLSETTQTRLTSAYENPELHRLEREFEEATPEQREDIGPRLKEARARHDANMQRTALALGATPEEIRAAGGATRYMANRVGNAFAAEGWTASISRGWDSLRGVESGPSARDYGTELITHGRASLLAGINLATRGWGTNEDLLRSTYAGRSRAEIKEARDQYRANTHGEDLDEMLGIRNREWGASDYVMFGLSPAGWLLTRGSETSGDLAFELERLSRGEPRTDADFAELAALEYSQQHDRGSGWLATLTMSGTPQEGTFTADRLALGRAIMDAAGVHGDPRNAFNADGSIRADLREAAFDPRGNFRGNAHILRDLSFRVQESSTSYRNEVDRQESLITGAITALAMVVTAVLLCIPGVNLVVAGVLTAVIAGALTIAAKASMRGERYGWEEMATDVATTALEAATAGMGGAMAGGLGKGVVAGIEQPGILAALARLGERLAGGEGATLLRRAAGAAAREAIVGAVSAAGQAALQDETWKDGFAAGLGRVLGSGARGAAVSAASAFVSTGVEGLLSKVLTPNLINGAENRLLGKLGGALGPGGREMLREVGSQVIGSLAGEAVAIFADVVTGDFHGGLAEALKRFGATGLREMMSTTLRTAAMARNKARHAELLAEARSKPSLTEGDVRALRLAAISAGADAGSLDDIRSEHARARVLLEGMPPALRGMVESLPLGDLEHLHSVLGSGKASSGPERLAFIHLLSQHGLDVHQSLFDEVFQAARARRVDDDFRASLPPHLRALAQGLDGEALGRLRQHLTEGGGDLPPELLARLAEAAPGTDAAAVRRALEEARTKLADDRTLAAARQERVRGVLGAAVEAPLRGLLEGEDLEALHVLSNEELAAASELVRHGRLDPEGLHDLMTKVRQRDPSVDRHAIERGLGNMAETVRVGRELVIAERRRDLKEVLAAVPEEAQHLFAQLPPETLGEIRRLLAAGERGSDAHREALFRAAQAVEPALQRGPFLRQLDDAVDNAAAARNTERRTQRRARYDRLTEVYPPEIRGPLSALPDHALMEIRALAARGEPLTPEVAARLLAAAQRETPGVDVARLRTAIDEAVRTPPRAMAAEEAHAMREQMLASVPSHLRTAVAETPILVVSREELAAYTRSESGEAVTLIVNGRPVIVVAEGARPGALREEGLHAAQAHDPRWREHVGALDEEKLGRWNELPLEEQLTLYRQKLDLEVDAHRSLVTDLEGEHARLDDPEARAAVAGDLEHARNALENLSRRAAEVEGLTPIQRRAMEVGVVAKPEWLEQPARLFAKDFQWDKVLRLKRLARTETEPLPKVPLEDGSVIDLDVLKRALLTARPNQLGEEWRQQLKQLGAAVGLIEGGRVAAGPDTKGGRWLSDLKDPILKTLVVEHLQRLLRSERGGLLAFVDRLASLRIFGEQHAHIEASISGRLFLGTETDPPNERQAVWVERLARALTSPEMLDQLKKLGLPAAGHEGETTLRDLAVEFLHAYGAHNDADGPTQKANTLRELRFKLDELLLGFSVHRDVDTRIEGQAKKAGMEEFFTAYGVLQTLVRKSLGSPPDVEALRQVLATRASSGEVAMSEGRASRDIAKRVRSAAAETAEVEHVIRFILSASKPHLKEGVDTGPSAFSGIIKAFFEGLKSGTRAFAQVVGLDSAGVEGKTPLFHTREFTQRTMGNLEETLTRLAKVEGGWEALLRHIDEVMPPTEGKNLRELVKALQSGDVEAFTKRMAETYRTEEALLKRRLNVDPSRRPAGEENNPFRRFLEGFEVDGLKLEDLAHLNRLAVDTLRQTPGGADGETAIGRGDKRLGQLGLTIHAGEQIAHRSAKGLLDDVEHALMLGTDRMGHALVLGMSAETLKGLGVVFGKGGQPTEAAFNQRRLELLARAKRLGVVIEMNLTSNLAVSNLSLGLHAAAELVRSGVRLSINTDDEALLRTTVGEEMHRFALVNGVGYKEVVAASLEAFASRLGAWELGDVALRLRTEWSAVISALPEPTRTEVIDHIANRFLGPHAKEQMQQAANGTAPTWEQVLDRVLRSITM